MDDQQEVPVASREPGAPQAAAAPLEAMLDFWRKAFTYSGRATRADYTWALLMFVTVFIVEGVSVQYIAPRAVSMALSITALIVFIVPWLALIARRCHDLNRRGAFGLLLLATGIGFLVTQGFLIFADSDPKGIRFDQPN